MAQDDSTGIIEAFEMLLEKLKAEIDAQNKLGAKAFEIGNLDAAQHAVDRAVHITSMIGQVTILRDAWEAITILPDTIEVEQFEQEPMVEVPQFKQESVQEPIKVVLPKAQRTVLDRLPKGIATPQSDYRQPILQALYEMGGSGRTMVVIERVGQIMQGVLQDVDKEIYPGTNMPRWSKFAQWERNTMREDGLIKPSSRKGTWELTEAGRQEAMRIS